MEITLQLRFCFVRHWKLFLITSQLRYLYFQSCHEFFIMLELCNTLVCLNYVQALRFKNVIFSNVC